MAGIIDSFATVATDAPFGAIGTIVRDSIAIGGRATTACATRICHT